MAAESSAFPSFCSGGHHAPAVKMSDSLQPPGAGQPEATPPSPFYTQPEAPAPPTASSPFYAHLAGSGQHEAAPPTASAPFYTYLLPHLPSKLIRHQIPTIVLQVKTG
jgi:hypothetical protein